MPLAGEVTVSRRPKRINGFMSPLTPLKLPWAVLFDNIDKYSEYVILLGCIAGFQQTVVSATCFQTVCAFL